MTKNWGWHPRCWGFVLPNHGSFCIGELPWSRRWGVEIGIGLRPNRRENEIRWRWWRIWHLPIVRLLWRNTGPETSEMAISLAYGPPLFVSAAWTGRRQEVIGIQIGGRLWVWAEPVQRIRMPIPDRVSVFTPKHMRFRYWNEIKVTLDGVDQDFVTAFCRSGGWVEQHFTDEDGHIARTPAGDAYATRRVHGKVTTRYG